MPQTLASDSNEVTSQNLYSPTIVQVFLHLVHFPFYIVFVLWYHMCTQKDSREMTKDNKFMKNDKGFVVNVDGAVPCKWCLRKNKEVVFPEVTIVDNMLFYAHCPKCISRNPYENCGTSLRGTILNWNEVNSRVGGNEGECSC